jgi:hypothetical protein
LKIETISAIVSTASKTQIYGLQSNLDVWHSFPTKSTIVLQSAAFVFVNFFEKEVEN